MLVVKSMNHQLYIHFEFLVVERGLDGLVRLYFDYFFNLSEAYRRKRKLY